MLDFAALLSEKTFSCSCRMQVTTNLMQEFARQVMFFNSKIRILSQKKLRDKLKIYLQTLEIAPDGTVCLPYSRRELSGISLRGPERSLPRTLQNARRGDSEFFGFQAADS